MYGVATGSYVGSLGLIVAKKASHEEIGQQLGEDLDIAKGLKTAGLDEVKKTPDGQMLDPDYCLRLLNFSILTTHKRRQAERDEERKRRLELFKEGKDAEYRELVKEQLGQEDQMSQAVLQEMMVELDTTESEFSKSFQIISLNPQFQQKLMAAQQGKLPAEEDAKQAPTKLTKQKTLEVYELSKQLTMASLPKQAESQKQMLMGNIDQMDMMIDTFVSQAKIDDEIFLVKGVRNDELEQAMIHFIAKDDPEVKKAMIQFANQMQAEMIKHTGMGMGM